MHYHCEIWTKDEPPDIRDFVDKVMEPFNEHRSEEGFWDFWSIGGRFSCAHKPDAVHQWKGDQAHHCMLVDEAPVDLEAWTVILVLDEVVVIHTEFYDGNQWRKHPLGQKVLDHLKDHGVKGGYLITVDYHG